MADANNTPWPKWIIESFEYASQPQFADIESACYGPYIRLLYHLFGLEGPSHIQPQYNIPLTPCGVTNDCDVAAFYTVEFHQHPVLLIEVMPLALFALDSKRKRADELMRDHFGDLRHNLVTPRLPGISVFGTHMAFYEYVPATNAITPHAISPDPVTLDDMAPAERWNYDLFEANGTAQMRKMVEDVKTMCQALNNCCTLSRSD